MPRVIARALARAPLPVTAMLRGSCVLSLTCLLLASANAIHAQGSDTVSDLLRTIDRGDGEEYDEAIEALARMGSRATPELAEVLESRSTSQRTRVGILRALGKMGRPGFLLYDERLRTLRDRSRLMILEATIELGPEMRWAVASLIDRARSAPRVSSKRKDGSKVGGGENDGVRSKAIRALGLIGEDAMKAVPTLTKIMAPTRRNLDHNDRGLRIHAAISLFWITRTSKPVFPVLLHEFEANAECEGCRGLAAFGLGELGREGERALPALTAALRQSSGELRKSLEEAIGKIEGRIPARVSARE